MSKHTLWKTLSCDLSSDEVAMYSNQLAMSTTEQAEIEAEKKVVMSTFQARLNKCIADQRLLAHKITTRKEDRQVECDLEFDYAKGMVYTVRMDTGVTIDQRKLTDDERQEKLDFEAEQDRKDMEEEATICVMCSNSGTVHLTRAFCDCQYGEELRQLSPPEPDQEHDITICGNKDCHYNDATEGNGCKQYEEVWDCKQAFQEGAGPVDAEPVPTDDPAQLSPLCERCHSAHPDCGACCKLCLRPCNAAQICLVDGEAREKEEAEQAALEAEETRRDGICKEWRECEHKDICFTPQNEEDGHCFVQSPEFIPGRSTDFSRCELKVLSGGFPLVRYNRDTKTVEHTQGDVDNDRWVTLPAFITYAAAERKLKELVDQGHIETGLDGKIVMTGWNRPGRLLEAGFEFYRIYGHRDYDQGMGCCIKVGSKNWANLAKYPDIATLQAAWSDLMNDDPKALEG